MEKKLGESYAHVPRAKLVEQSQERLGNHQLKPWPTSHMRKWTWSKLKEEITEDWIQGYMGGSTARLHRFEDLAMLYAIRMLEAIFCCQSSLDSGDRADGCSTHGRVRLVATLGPPCGICQVLHSSTIATA